MTALAVGLFANAAILPLLAYFFGSTSMFSVGLTLLLSPVLTPALALSALSLLLPWCIPITYLSRMLLKLILFLAYRTSEIPNAMVLLNGTVTMILVNLLVLLTVLLAVVELKRKKWMLLPLLLSVAVLLVAYADVMPRGTGTSVTYLRSQSDEALVIAKERTAVAIDFSEGTSAIGKRIVSAVTEAKCTELGELILTHYHSDASHLIASLTSQIKLRTLRLPIPNCEKETAIAARLEQEAELHGVAVRYGTDELALEGLEVRMLQRTADENRIEVPTLVSLLINEHSLVYLGGNIWSSEWFSYAESASISSEILILGAHGTTSLPNEKIFGKLTNTKRIIFGSRELFFQCPYDALPHEYAAEVEFKRFFLK